MNQHQQPEKRHIADDGAERRAVDDMPLEIRAAIEGQPSVIGGYAALFNRESRILQTVVQGEKRNFKEVILPGALDGADMSRTEARLDHNKAIVLAVAPNSLRLKVDERGLHYEFDYDASDPDHQRTLARSNRGDIRTSSFAFYVAPGGDRWENKGTMWMRTISKVRLVEDVAPVTGHNAAYADTTMAARSLERRCMEIESAEQAERDLELRGVELRILLAQYSC
jgi:HK97 family phage prohead protease